MIAVPTQLQALLASRPQSLVRRKLYAITLPGFVYRTNDGQLPVTPEYGALAGITYPSVSPDINVTAVSTGIGGDGAEASAKLSYDANSKINGTPVQQLIAAGGFNLCGFAYDWAYAAAPGEPFLGTVNRFTGIITDIEEVGAVSATLKIKSYEYLLDTDWPRNTIMPQCVHVLYSPGCGASKAAHTFTGACIGGSTVNTVQTNLTQADDFFDLGTITFTSGVLNGLSYWIRKYASSAARTSYSMIAAPSSGDTFTITQGCDRTQATCSARFSRLASFRGFPNVPQPETSY